MTMLKYTLILLLALFPRTSSSQAILIGCRPAVTDTIEPSPPAPRDTTRPAAISTLAAYDSSTSSVSLRWATVGDDSLTGTATSYDLRYSTRLPSRGELITNSTFVISTAGWQLVNGYGALSHSADSGHTAAGSLMLINTTPYSGVVFPIANSGADSCTVSMYVWTAVADTLDLYVLDQDSVIIGGSLQKFIPARVWTQISRTIKLTGAQTEIRPGFNFDPGVAGDTVYVDDASCVVGVPWETLTSATGEPTPKVFGQYDSLTIPGLSDDTQYYFAIKATDDSGNVSALSNIAGCRTEATPAGGAILSVETGYYVDTAGNAGNSGKDSLHYWSMSKALTDAGSELGTGYDTVLVNPGVYSVALSPALSGLVNQRIVWMKRGYGEVIIQGASGQYQTMVVSESCHTFDGFTIKNQDPNDVPLSEAPDYNAYYMITASGNYTVIRNCRLPLDVDVADYCYGASPRKYRAIELSGKHQKVEHSFLRGWNMGIVETGSSPRYNTIRADTFHCHFQSAINLQTSQDGTTEFHGTVVDSCVIDTSLQEDGIQFEDYAPDPTNTALHKGVVIKDNRIARCAENGIDLKTTSFAWIEGNIIHGCEGDDDGIYGSAHDMGSGPAIERHNQDSCTENIVVRYNIVYDNLRGFTTTSIYQAYNNTFVNNRRTYNGPNQLGTDFTHMTPWSPWGPVEVFNNIFMSIPYESNSTLILAGPSTAIYDINYNMDWDSSGSVAWGVGAAGSYTYYTSLATWTAATTYDATSIYDNPEFEDTPQYPYGYNASWTFGLSVGSPAVDAGKPHSVASNGGVGSTALTVANPYLFRPSFGNTDITGDFISIGGGEAVEIASVDYSTGAITLAAPRTWSIGNSIILTAYVSDGTPDIGAKER